jgi:hypothetical protein
MQAALHIVRMHDCTASIAVHTYSQAAYMHTVQYSICSSIMYAAAVKPELAESSVKQF